MHGATRACASAVVIRGERRIVSAGGGKTHQRFLSQ
jgi:hypothetical protein